MKLKPAAAQYLDKAIVNKVVDKIRDFEQIAAFLAILEIMSYDKFPNLIGFVAGFNEISALKRYVRDNRIARPVELLYKHFTRKKFLLVMKDLIKTREKLATCYSYVVQKLFEEIQKRAKEDWTLLQNQILLEHTDLIENLLRTTDNEVQLAQIKDYCARKNCENQEEDILTFFGEKKEDLRRLCVLPMRQVELLYTIQQSRNIRNFFESSSASKLENQFKQSQYVKHGGLFFISPTKVEWLTGIVSGLFTAAILAAILAAITPGIIALSPFILGPITAIATIAIMVGLPVLLGKLAATVTKKVNSHKQDQYEKSLQVAKPKYADLITAYRLKGMDETIKKSSNSLVSGKKKKYDRLDEQDNTIGSYHPLFN